MSNRFILNLLKFMLEVSTYIRVAISKNSLPRKRLHYLDKKQPHLIPYRNHKFLSNFGGNEEPAEFNYLFFNCSFCHRNVKLYLVTQ